MARSFLRLLLGLPLFGCGGSLPHPPYVAQTTAALVMLELPPPPGRVERIPAMPVGADAWVDGEWILRRARWYWLLGRWVKTPPATKYAPWVVVRALDGTAFYAPSQWQDREGRRVAAPPALAFATADGSAVYDPEGQVDDTGRAIKTVPVRRSPVPAEARPGPTP